MSKSILRPSATFAAVALPASQLMASVIPPIGLVLRLYRVLLISALFLAQLSLPRLSTAAPYRVLHNFSNGTQLGPTTGVVVDGFTVYGAVGSSLYAMNTDGSNYHAIHSFTGGANGLGTLGDLTLIGSKLYGTSVSGGVTNVGFVFSLDTDGSNFQVVHSFVSSTEGALPRAGLTLVGSTLYGTTSGGGPTGFGTTFALNTDGSDFRVLHGFGGANSIEGQGSHEALIAVGQTLYGTMHDFNPFQGNIFKINTDGSGYEVLHTYASGGPTNPEASLLSYGSMLYGTTAFGGFGGTVFRMNLDGSNYQTLHFFNDIETGTNPQAGLTLFGSRLYGTTQNGGFQTVESVRNGTIFSLNLDGSDFRIEHAFHDGIDGGNPVANLTLAPGGLFGTTPGKGGNNNIGTVFLLAVPEPSSIVLAAVGLIGLAAWGWRRRTGS